MRDVSGSEPWDVPLFCPVGNGCLAGVAVDYIVLRYDEFFPSLREVQSHILRVAGSVPLLRMGPYAHAGGDRVIQPYMRKKLTPRTLLPFPWDAESTTAYGEKVEYISREYALQRFEQMLEK